MVLDSEIKKPYVCIGFAVFSEFSGGESSAFVGALRAPPQPRQLGTALAAVNVEAEISV